MSSNIVNQSPYLRTSRNFPEESTQALVIEVNRAYVDIASKVNDRIIGIYPTAFPAITGERWFFSGGNTRQQALRRIYTFNAAGNISHGLTWDSISKISPRSYGSFTDGTNWYGAVYASNTAIAAQVSFYVTSSNIVVLRDAAAPTISSGTIVLEWLSQI